MPNWCYTKITFHGDKNEIEDFHKKLNDWTSTEFIPNGFGNSWLGNILHKAGLGDRVDNQENPLRCRGQVIYIEGVEVNSETDATFYLDTETAWCPMIKMWIETIKALDYKTIGFSYLAEEMGMELYEIYDPYGDYDESYYVDSWLDGEDENNDKLCYLQDNIYHCSDDDLISTLQYVMDTDEKDVEKLIEKIQNYPFKGEDSYISVHKYEKRDNLEEEI